MSRPRISLDDVLLPARTFSISHPSSTRLVSLETSNFILDTISKDPKLQALCLPQSSIGSSGTPPPPIRAVAPVWPPVEPWRPGLQPPRTGSWTQQQPAPIDWPLGPRTADPYADYCNPVEAYERICASIHQRQADLRNPSAQPAKRLKVEAAPDSDPGSEIPPVNKQHF